MCKRGSQKQYVYTRPSLKAIASIKGRVRTMTYRRTLHHDPGYLMDYLGMVAAWLGDLLPPRCLQADLQCDRLLRLGADHVLAAEEAPDRMARSAAQVLPPRRASGDRDGRPHPRRRRAATCAAARALRGCLRRLAQGPGRGVRGRDRARRAGPVPRLRQRDPRRPTPSPCSMRST
jgi:hypothetical protein